MLIWNTRVPFIFATDNRQKKARCRSVLIFLNPRVEVAAVEMHPPPHAYHGQLSLEDQMLNGLLAPVKIDRSLLHAEEQGLDRLGRDAPNIVPEESRNLLRNRFCKSVKHRVTTKSVMIFSLHYSSYRLGCVFVLKSPLSPAHRQRAAR